MTWYRSTYSASSSTRAGTIAVTGSARVIECEQKVSETSHPVADDYDVSSGTLSVCGSVQKKLDRTPRGRERRGSR